MASDAALLEEVSTFLDTSGLLLAHSSHELPAEDDNDQIAQLDTLEPTRATMTRPPPYISKGSYTNTDESNTSSNKAEVDAITRKPKRQREKEVIRKQSYQLRLKNERETLRRMEKELTSQVLQLKKTSWGKERGSTAKRTHINAHRRELAKQEREERRRAEHEREQLLHAIGIQASYLANLQEVLPQPGHLGLVPVEIYASSPSGCQGNVKVDRAHCSIDFDFAM